MSFLVELLLAFSRPTLRLILGAFGYDLDWERTDGRQEKGWRTTMVKPGIRPDTVGAKPPVGHQPHNAGVHAPEIARPDSSNRRDPPPPTLRESGENSVAPAAATGIDGSEKVPSGAENGAAQLAPKQKGTLPRQRD